MGDKNYFGRQFEQRLTEGHITVIRPTRKGEEPRRGGEFLKTLRQVIESIFDTFKDQLDLERHADRTPAGVTTRIAQRILALTTVIWHNDRIGAPTLRALTAHDH